MIWTPRDVQQAFDKAVSTYDSVATVQHQVAEQLVQNLPPLSPETIVDLGCGTGYVTDALLRLYPTCSYSLVDLSDGMIQFCRGKYADQNNFTYEVADMDEWSSAKSDLVISSLAFQWSRDLTALLAKLASTSTTVAFATLVKGTFREWEELLNVNGIPSPLLPLPSAQELTSLCRQINPQSQITLAEFSLVFTGISDFIQYLRDLGATQGPGIKNSAKFKSLIQHHDDPIKVTYRVLFGFMTK